MNPPDISRWKIRILLLFAVFIMIYGLDRLILFMRTPYNGIYGEFRSNGYQIRMAIDVKSTEPLMPGMVIKYIEGIPVEEWIRSFLHIPCELASSWSFEKPLNIETLDRQNLSKAVLLYPRRPSIEDLFRNPFWLWIFAFSILLFGTYLLFINPGKYPTHVLSILLFSTALNMFNDSGRHLLLEISPRFPLIIAVSIGTMGLIFSSWFHLILIFLKGKRYLRVPAWIPWITYVLPPLLTSILLLSFWGSPLVGIEISYRILYLIAVLVVSFNVGILLHAFITTTDPILKAQLKWVLWGHILGVSPYLLLYSLPRMLIGAPFIHHSLSLIPLPLILFSFLFAFYRYRLMDVDPVIHGSLVYGVSVIILLSLFLLFLGFFLHKVVMPPQTASWVRIDLLLLLGAALVFNPLKNLVQKGIDRSLFPERIGLPLLLMEGSNKLTGASDLKEISEYLLEDLPERISVGQAALILRQEFEGGWEFLEKPKGWIEANKEMNSWLDKLSLESLPQFWDPLSEDEIVDQPTFLTLMKAQGVAIIFPMNSGDDLWGFYLLGNKRTKRLLSSEEIHVIATLCTQASHMVGNARLMEGLRRTNWSLVDLSNRLIQAERIADLGEGAATLAHELKNPLGIVRGSAEILIKETDQDKKNEVLGFILEEVDRLAGTIDQFLQFARMSPPSKSEVDLNDLVHSAAFLWESRRRSIVPLSIRFQLDNKVGKVSLDSRQIYQGLLNIFTNAEEAMSEGGEMSISTGIDTEARQVWISVKDTGKGITPEHLERVFDRFFTTKDSGLGLGLTVVRKVIEAHGGSVKIESSPGNGTKVALFFPTDKNSETE